MTNKSIYTHTNHPAFLYQEMLSDQYRMQCYRRAINEVVEQGDVVVDLGTGTGVLAIMAVQAGASHVYAVEVRPQIIPITRQIIADNGMSEQITVIEGDARNITLTESVDVIINELIGDFGTDENIAECVNAVAERYLKPSGTILPRTLKTYLVPVQYQNEYQGIWRENFQGIDLKSVAKLDCVEEAQMRILSHQPTELATPQLIENIDFSKDKKPRLLAHDIEFHVHTAGALHGFMGYFESELTHNVSINNYPGYKGCHWQTWHWPVYPTLNVEKSASINGMLATPENMIAQGWNLTWSHKA
ncbi:50S ribosomal protein L11 methyltransferase [Thalassotalea atypica]|uniref:50S ribosomal protein L11 methyltransferase n=1 Tax=Thalassotalea atypica TaxID=2054316 RepID=UPI002572BD8E|nr:50S ribosomal protein L11 methyltransferase [Thalassotalea atypica]